MRDKKKVWICKKKLRIVSYILKIARKGSEFQNFMRINQNLQDINGELRNGLFSSEFSFYMLWFRFILFFRIVRKTTEIWHIYIYIYIYSKLWGKFSELRDTSSELQKSQYFFSRMSQFTFLNPHFMELLFYMLLFRLVFFSELWGKSQNCEV